MLSHSCLQITGYITHTSVNNKKYVLVYIIKKFKSRIEIRYNLIRVQLCISMSFCSCTLFHVSFVLRLVPLVTSMSVARDLD